MKFIPHARLLLPILALLLITTAPAFAREWQIENPPEITVLEDGLQRIPFLKQDSIAAIRSYPFLKPLIENILTTELMTKNGLYRGTSNFRTAMMKAPDLKTNFVFLYVDSPLNCTDNGCAFFAFTNEGKGYENVTPMFAREPIWVSKKGTDLALVMPSSAGRVKWRFSDNAFNYAGLFYGENSDILPEKEKAGAPMSAPAIP